MSLAAWRPSCVPAGGALLPPRSPGRRGLPAGRRGRGEAPRAVIGLPSPRDARPRPLSASAPGSGRSGAEWARARRRGRAGARGPWLAASQRSLPSMRTEAAGGAERRPQKPRSQAAAPACRGTWRSPQSAEPTPATQAEAVRLCPLLPRGPATPPQPCDAGRACRGARAEGRGPGSLRSVPPAAGAGVEAAQRVRTT